MNDFLARGCTGLPAQLTPTWKRYGLGKAVDIALRHDGRTCGLDVDDVYKTFVSAEGRCWSFMG